MCLPPSDYVYGTHDNLTVTGWGKMGYEGGEGDTGTPFSSTASASTRPLRGVVHLREAQVPIISRRQ